LVKQAFYKKLKVTTWSILSWPATYPPGQISQRHGGTAAGKGIDNRLMLQGCPAQRIVTGNKSGIGNEHIMLINKQIEHPGKYLIAFPGGLNPVCHDMEAGNATSRMQTVDEVDSASQRCLFIVYNDKNLLGCSNETHDAFRYTV
jgi:hypothetical protein